MLSKISNAGAALKCWVDTRRLHRDFKHRQAFLEWQEKQLQTWLAQCAPKVPRYGHMPANARLADFPIVDKSDLMGDFSSFNVAGVTANDGWQAFEGTRMCGPWHVGASTGTSGNRGLFVISERERYLWLGTILGKLLPDIWKRRHRIAVILPLHTRLYDTANDTPWTKLRFFDLSSGFESWIEDLVAFNPSIIVAPPRALRWVAENAGTRLQPDRLYSGAEVLDPVDRDAIGAHWKAPLGQIYMATEGLLATTCSHGTLHLCEDIMHFELEDAGGGLVSPIITDFRRQTQIMCRYRLNDLLRLSSQPCSCGSPLLSVEEIVGRKDDCFCFLRAGREVLVTPDVMRNAVLDADRKISDFRIIQHNKHVELQLPPEVEATGRSKALAGLEEIFSHRGISVEVELTVRKLSCGADRKLRRVQNARGLCH